MIDGFSRWLDPLGSLKFFVPHWPIGTALSFPVFRWWMMMVNFMASAPVSGHPTMKWTSWHWVYQLFLIIGLWDLMSLSAAISGVFIPSKCQGCQGTTIGYQTAGFNASCEANATCTWGQKHGLWQFWQTPQFFQQLFNRPFKNLIFKRSPHLIDDSPIKNHTFIDDFSYGDGSSYTISLGKSVHPLPSYMLLIKVASGSGFDENSHMHGTNMSF